MLLLFATAMLCSCSRSGGHHSKDEGCSSCHPRFEINGVDWCSKLDEAKWFLYFFNISDENDWGILRKEDSLDSIKIVECEPRFERIRAKGDTLRYGFMFEYKGIDVFPRRTPNFDIYYSGGKIIAVGAGATDGYIPIGDGDWATLTEQEQVFKDYLIKNKNDWGRWLRESKYVKKKLSDQLKSPAERLGFFH